MPESDARARIAAQADAAARRAAADVWLDNSGTPGELLPRIDRLWHDRLVPFERVVRAGGPVASGSLSLVVSDPDWSDQAAKLVRRVQWAAGDGATRVDHVGSTAVPGLDARDVLDLQLTVVDPAPAAGLAARLREVGFVPSAERDVFESADPARAAALRVIGEDGAGRFDGCVIRDWLRLDGAALGEYLELKRRAAKTGDINEYAAAKAEWFEASWSRAAEVARGPR